MNTHTQTYLQAFHAGAQKTAAGMAAKLIEDGKALLAQGGQGLVNGLGKVEEFSRTDPNGMAITGAAGGAAVGAASGLVAPGTDAQGNRKSRLKAALMRGLAGGVIGGGAGHMMDHAHKAPKSPETRTLDEYLQKTKGTPGLA